MALGKHLKMRMQRQKSDIIRCIEGLRYPTEAEVRERLTTRTLGDLIMDLKILKM